MASTEDFRLRSINAVLLNTSPVIKYIEPRSGTKRSSLTSITVIPRSEISGSPILSLIKGEEYDQQQISTPRPRSAKPLSMAAISHQLSVRKTLENRLGLISNIMCFLGLLGIILMIIENEITFGSVNHTDTNISWFIKLMISISTVILVGLVISYHYLNMKLYAAQNSLDHWYVGLSIEKFILFILEILICAIHPMPRYFPRKWTSRFEEILTNSTSYDSFTLSSVSLSYIATDVALGLPMFARLYLIGRCIKFRSHLVRHAPSKSFGSLNRVSINFTFLMKLYLEQWPVRCLILFCCTMFFIGSWSIRACDYKPKVVEHISMLNSMWFFIVTFTTVGYGDLTPSTYCGRSKESSFEDILFGIFVLAVASCIVLFGLLSSALVISVVAQRLQLTRWEKSVHNFVSDIELTRKRREQAANVIKFAIKVWYLKRKHHHRSLQYLRTQRLLFNSIHYCRTLKYEQRKLNDNCLNLPELINNQRYTNIKTKKMAKEVTTTKLTIDKIEDKFNQMNNTINNIQQTLNLLLDKNIK